MEKSNTSAHTYNKEYYEKHCGDLPYTREQPQWIQFFDGVATEIVRCLNPRTVLDVGCAIGFLIEALWRHGVNAFGIEVSEYALSQVPADLKTFCRLSSATEPLPEDLPQQYDLITCIEVVEHIPEADAKQVVRNLAAWSDSILFSSTPNDLTEPTHINVRPVVYWLQLFAEVGLFPDLRFDASFVSPQALLLRKRVPTVGEDTLPFFADVINKKFEIKFLQEKTLRLENSLNNLKESLDHQTADFTKQVSQLTSQNDTLKATVNETKNAFESARTERDKLQENLIALTTDYEKQIRDLTASRKILIEKLEESERRLAAHRDDVEILRKHESILAGEVMQLREASSNKDSAIVDRDRRIESFQVTQSGLLWDLFVSYRKLKDFAFPPESYRRSAYDKILGSVKFLKTKLGFVKVLFIPFRHPINTAKHLNRVNIDKFAYHLKHSTPAVLETKMSRKTGTDAPPSALPANTTVNKFCLIVSGCPGDAFRYRCEHQAEQLKFLGFTLDLGYFDQIDFNRSLNQYRCFWFHRVPHTEGIESFVRQAKQLGKMLIFDTDDLIFDENKISFIRALRTMSQDEIDLYYDGVRRYHRTMSLFDFVTVTTEPLKDAVLEVFPSVRCYINPNMLSDAQIGHAEAALKIVRPLEDRNVVRIAYFSGTRTHNVDFEECAPALIRVLDAYPQVHVMFVGHLDLPSSFDRFGPRVERHPLVPWQELPALYRKVDINLAPLELANPFTASKSALKYFEAAIMGVPTLASDVPAYQKDIKDGENGFLCSNETEWFEALSRLIADRDFRLQIGSRAREQVTLGCSTRVGAVNLKEIFREVASATEVNETAALRIAFVTRAPIPQVGGGYKNIFRLAQFLARVGHDVHIYVEAIAHLEGKTDKEIVRFCHQYFGESAVQIHVGHQSIVDADVAIATNWPTAYVVEALQNAICKFYLIQDFEPEFYDYESSLYLEAERTYSLPLKKVTLGPYLASLFEPKDKTSVTYIDFAIDPEIFNAESRTQSEGPVSILFFARPTLKRRGFNIGVEALSLVHKHHPEAEIRLYGMEQEQALPFPYIHLGQLSPAALADEMRRSDIHLSFSLTNISYVPFEAMACGCAVVEAKVAPVEVMVDNGLNCLLAEPNSITVSDALCRLIEDSNLRSKMSAAGLDFMKHKTWHNACESFHRILLDSLLLKALPKPGRNEQVEHQVSSPIDTSITPSSGPVDDVNVVLSSCNLCRSEKFDIVYRTSPQIVIKSSVVSCSECGLKRVQPRLDQKDQLWSSTATYLHRDYIPHWAKLGCFKEDGAFDPQGNLNYWWPNVLKRAQEYRRNGRFLDVGCNMGLLVEAASRTGWQASGIDISVPAIQFGRSEFGVDIHVGAIDDDLFSGELFDVVCMWDVIEHLTDPLGALECARRRLRPGGALIVQTPNYNGPSRRVLGERWEMFSNEHFYYFEVRQLRKMLKHAGFQSINIETVGFDRSRVVSILKEPTETLREIDKLSNAGGLDELDTIIALAEKTTQ